MEYLKKMLELNNVHVRPDTYDLIIRGAFDWLPCYPKTDPETGDNYGAFICAYDVDPTDENGEIDDIPEDLLEVLRYADAFDAEWIMLDVDAAELGELPMYRDEWDRYVCG